MDRARPVNDFQLKGSTSKDFWYRPPSIAQSMLLKRVFSLLSRPLSVALPC